MHSTERIGRYRLERRLGAGAFGVVWLAHDGVLEATVAVKVLADNWTDRMDIRERFLSEERLLRRGLRRRHLAQLGMPDFLDRAREIRIDLRQMPHRLLEIGGIENHLSHAGGIACGEGEL